MMAERLTFVDALREAGNSTQVLDGMLAEAVAAAEANGKATITVKMTVSPGAAKGAAVISVAPQVKLPPTPPRTANVFFTEDGGVSRDKPYQTDMRKIIRLDEREEA